MTLDQALAYLETTARVSCPQITCEQAAEIAELMRDLSDQHQVDIAEMVSWKVYAATRHNYDQALTKLKAVKWSLKTTDELFAECQLGLVQARQERDEALKKLREVERERDEATYTSEPPKPKKQKKVKQ